MLISQLAVSVYALMIWTDCNAYRCIAKVELICVLFQ